MISYHSLLLVLAFTNVISALQLPGPKVYVVTPAPRNKAETGRSAPFYYHSWLRRSDTPRNETTTAKTTTTKAPNPDLIFAEFESEDGNNAKKSIRKLLEKESTETRPSTSKPIYVADEDQIKHSSPDVNEQDSDEYFSMYNHMYNNPSAPVYMPSTTVRTTTTTLKATTEPDPKMVENIWHIIDNEKQTHQSEGWQEYSINDNNERVAAEEGTKNHKDFPSVAVSHETGAENESRGIRTESRYNFPYVNLKTVQMKNPKKNNMYSSKKGNNLYMDVNNYQNVFSPVRGEAEDGYKMPIDRFNPAQPYIPGAYGSDTKKQNPRPDSTKTVASLVPPPPPPLPPTDDDGLPPPPTYESFPPYTPDLSGPGAGDSQPPPADSQSNGYPAGAPVLDLGYKLKPQSGPKFLLTLPPLSKPVSGYSYPNPMMESAAPPADEGYTYNKPPMPPANGGYTYNKPPMPSADGGYTYNKPPVPEVTQMLPSKTKFGGYNYDKPAVSFPSAPGPSYGDHHHNSDYPDLIFDKPHGAKDNDIGMKPPPPPPAVADVQPGPVIDGFPQDFPGDFKYGHDFDDHDHDFYHHHHHHPTTTTTTSTTETPRVNRYSYYFLGKKLYYLPLYFSIYFIVYVAALIIKAVLRHKIVYPNSWRPNDTTATFFSKRSIDSWHLSNESMHELTGFVTKAIGIAAEKYSSKTEESS